MAEGNAQPQAQAYGFSEGTERKASKIKFGLNTDVYLKKFAWTANGGKEGAEMEALDIVFEVNGEEKSYRRFPVTRAYINDADGNRVEITDPTHDAFKAEVVSTSAVLVHIIGCFVDKAALQSALTTQINSFEHYCSILASLLPSDFSMKKLDVFMGYQWQIGGEAKVTYIEFPKNMKHGRWLTPAVVPVGGEWKEMKRLDADNNAIALKYVDSENKAHPFTRNGWYVASNFAKQQKEAPSAAGMNMQAGTSAPAGAVASTPSGDGW
jgi:hypothetical protein